MNSRDPEQYGRERAWELLELVEDHPQVRNWLRAADEVFSEQHIRAARQRSPIRPLWAAAASIAGLAIIAAALGYGVFGAQHYETQIGEQRDVILSDGSKVTLNTNTSVRIRYTQAQRYLVLERGEALFAVAHDAARPFDVAAGNTLTRAVGTEFNVDMRQATVTVSVLEGAVRVSALDPAIKRTAISQAPQEAAAAAAVAKGQAIEFRSREGRAVAEKADLERIGAWRMRRLEFSDTPLIQAVEEFNRYSTTQLVIGTSDLGSVRVSGVFRIDDAAGFLYSLHQILGVEAHESAHEVWLTRAGPG